MSRKERKRSSERELTNRPEGLVTRRQAIGKAGAIAAAGVAGLVVGGAAGYFSGSSSAAPRTETVTSQVGGGSTVTQTQTVTQSQTVTVGAQSSGMTFYYLSVVPLNAFFSIVNKGFQDACAELGAKGVYLAPTTEGDIAATVNNFESTIAANPDGIAVSYADPAAFTPPTKDAVSKGIPVVASNSIDPRSISERAPYLNYIGEDSYAVGVALAQRMLEFFQQQFGRVPKRALYVNFAPGINVLTIRGQGFKDTMTKAGATADEIPSKWDANQIGSDVKSYYAAHPDTEAMVSGFIVISGWIYQGLLEVKATDKVFVGAVDLTPDGLQSILDGKIVCTIDQQPYLQGYYAAHELFLNKKYKFVLPNNIYTGPYVVDKSNAQALIDLSKQGYR